jgi:phosphoribosylaminoimidazole-succinocarboxamide synthase
MLSTAQTRSEVDLPGLEPWRRGKVRAVYEAGPKHLVIVASDRLSAYDHVLPTPIPQKGRVLTELSIFWFGMLKSATPHHFMSEILRSIRSRSPVTRRRSKAAACWFAVPSASTSNASCGVISPARDGRSIARTERCAVSRLPEG